MSAPDGQEAVERTVEDVNCVPQENGSVTSIYFRRFRKGGITPPLQRVDGYAARRKAKPAGS